MICLFVVFIAFLEYIFVTLILWRHDPPEFDFDLCAFLRPKRSIPKRSVPKRTGPSQRECDMYNSLLDTYTRVRAIYSRGESRPDDFFDALDVQLKYIKSKWNTPHISTLLKKMNVMLDGWKTASRLAKVIREKDEQYNASYHECMSDFNRHHPTFLISLRKWKQETNEFLQQLKKKGKLATTLRHELDYTNKMLDMWRDIIVNEVRVLNASTVPICVQITTDYYTFYY
jgi:hypothetical protein